MTTEEIQWSYFKQLLMNKADTILKSTNIYIGIGNSLLSGFVAVKDGKVLYVGKIDELDDYINTNTKIIDFKDKLIMPGIHDGHLHFFMSGLYASDKVKVSYTDRSEEECVNGLKEIEGKNTKDEWMIGAGWYHTLWDKPKLPTKHSLDKVYPNRPVAMFSYDCHTLWINSAGLKKLNIDKNYPDIDGGIIDRDENGEPLGTFHEAAYAKLLQEIYDFDKDYIKDFYKSFIYSLNSYGITSVCDMSMTQNPGNDFIRDDIFKELEDENELTIRIHMYPSLANGFDRPNIMRDKYKGPYLFCNGVKAFFDGVSSCHTAWLFEPYSNAYYEGDVGSTITSPDKMKEYVLLSHKNDFSIRVHTIGDKAISKMIDYIIEAKEKYGDKPYLQHTLEHLENLNEEDISRLASNNIIPSVQPAHSVFDMEGVEKDLGKERIELMWPFRSELDTGCILAFGTDSPVVDINPFYGIYNAVTRKHTFTRFPANGWIPKERITVFEAISAYTYGSACASNASALYGTLEIGKYADICVLDRNICMIDPEEIPQTKCIFTMVGGKVVYENNR